MNFSTYLPLFRAFELSAVALTFYFDLQNGFLAMALIALCELFFFIGQMTAMAKFDLLCDQSNYLEEDSAGFEYAMKEEKPC